MAEFLRPTSVDEALTDLRREHAVPVAGATQVALLMRTGLLEVDTLVWLGAIPDLRQIGAEGERLSLGAAVTLHELSRSTEVRRLHPALAAAALEVGNPRVRSAATLGGHLAHADPRQDLPPLLIALGAVVVIAGLAGTRRIPISDFFTGFMSTALEPGELLTAVEVPGPAEGRRASYVRFAPTSASDYAAVGVAGALTVSDGVVGDAAVALGAGASTPRAVPAAGAALLGRPGDADIRRASMAVESAADPVDDQRGSAVYKRAMAGLWSRRLIHELLA